MTCLIVLRGWSPPLGGRVECQGRFRLPRAVVPTEENLVSLVLYEASCTSYKARSPAEPGWAGEMSPIGR